MKRSKWPLVSGVVVVGALAGVALGGRPTTLPEVKVPATTVAPDGSVPASETTGA
ncbi:MAG: hypothetical protein ACOYMR_08745 [Ilumatobacteraceae bacterium]